MSAKDLIVQHASAPGGRLILLNRPHIHHPPAAHPVKTGLSTPHAIDKTVQQHHPVRSPQRGWLGWIAP